MLILNSAKTPSHRLVTFDLGRTGQFVAVGVPERPLRVFICQPLNAYGVYTASDTSEAVLRKHQKTVWVENSTFTSATRLYTTKTLKLTHTLLGRIWPYTKTFGSMNCTSCQNSCFAREKFLQLRRLKSSHACNIEKKCSYCVTISQIACCIHTRVTSFYWSRDARVASTAICYGVVL